MREAGGERLRTGVCQHAPDLPFQDSGVQESPLGREPEQLLVRSRGPKEEGHAGCQVEIAQAIALALSDVRRFPFQAEEKRRTREDRLKRGSDPDLESPFRGAAIEERHRTCDIRGGDRSPVRFAQKTRHDRFGAGTLLRGRRGHAREDLTATRRLGDHPCGTDRPRDHEVGEVGQRSDPVVGPSLRVFAPDERPVEGTQPILVGPVDLTDERRHYPVLTRSDDDRLRPDRNAPAPVVLEGQQRHAFAVDRKIDILEGRAPAEERLHLEHVRAVGREVVGDDDSATRPVGGAFELVPRVLRDLDRTRVLRRGRDGVRNADSQTADLRGRPHVCLEQRRREPLCGRQVVEAAQVGVRGKPAAGVHVERQQVTDHALVLGPVESLEPSPAGIRVGQGRFVDDRLERLHECPERVARRPPGPGRRHHPGPELQDHLLSGFGPRVSTLDHECLQRQVPRQPALIVAADAILLDHLGGRSGGGIGKRGHGSCFEPGRAGPGGVAPRRKPYPQQGGTSSDCLHASSPEDAGFRRSRTIPAA